MASGVSQLSLLNRTWLTEMISQFSVRKACFWIPPTKAPRWRGACVVAKPSHRNLGVENRGKRKRLPQRQFPRLPRKLPKHPRFFTVEFKNFDRWVSPPINIGGRRHWRPAITFTPSSLVKNWWLVPLPSLPASRFCESFGRLGG
jgi:hypothetical protein